jgi:hypothetical protein
VAQKLLSSEVFLASAFARHDFAPQHPQIPSKFIRFHHIVTMDSNFDVILARHLFVFVFRNVWLPVRSCVS